MTKPAFDHWLLCCVTSAAVCADGAELADLPPGAFGVRCRGLAAGPLFGVAAPLCGARQIAQPTAEDLLAYSRVVDLVHARHTAVPIRYGSTFGSDAAIRTYLHENAAHYERLLQQFVDRVEVAVRTAFSAEIAQSLPSLENSAPRISAGSTGTAYLRRLQAQQEKMRATADAAARQGEQIYAALAPGGCPHRVETRTDNPGGVIRDIAVSFLLKRDAVSEFRRRVEELQQKAQRPLRFLGPFAPYSFAELAPP